MSKVRYSTLAEYLENVETQEKLAGRLGITQATVSRAKRGYGSYRLLKKISQVTGVPLDSFERKDAA